MSWAARDIDLGKSSWPSRICLYVDIAVSPQKRGKPVIIS